MDYIVVGPERCYVESVPGCHGDGPRYDVHDVYYVTAPSRRVAKWAAWRQAKLNRDLWATEIGHDHPLKGVKVEEAGPADMYGAWGAEYVVNALGERV